MAANATRSFLFAYLSFVPAESCDQKLEVSESERLLPVAEVILSGATYSAPVEVAGVFSWEESSEYDGVLLNTHLSRYESPIHKVLYVDLRCDREVRHLLDRRDVDVIGRVVDVCKSTSLGPALRSRCHFSRSILKVEVMKLVEIGETRYPVIRSEMNRNLVTGQFASTRIDAGVKSSIEEAVSNRLDLMFSRTIALSPRSDLYHFFTKHPDGPLKGKKLKFDPSRYAIFGPEVIDRSIKASMFTACYCVIDDCSDRWPIDRRDAMTSIEDFVCEKFVKTRADKGWRVDLSKDSL